MTDLAALLADCEAHGIRLLLAGDGGLTIDAPEDALTPDLLGGLKAHKAEVLEHLATLNTAEAVGIFPHGLLVTANRGETHNGGEPTCRCGSTTWRDVPIHGGESVRRDCGRCGRFLDFPVWYGTNLTS
jgi:hypothetical protein